AAVRLRDGAALRAANFIIAVPPVQLLKLLPQALAGDRVFARLATLKSSPIICIHVWLDHEVISSAFVGFVGTTTQWLFNKRRIFNQNGTGNPGYLSLVISGAGELAERPNDELLEVVMNDLGPMIPETRQAHVMKALVPKEKHAPFAPAPASDAV